MTENSAAQTGSAAPRGEAGRFMRFLVAGGVNTGLSLLVYQGALFVMPHIPSYVLAYIAGLIAAYVLYSRHVFGAPLSRARFAAFTLFYIASLVTGTLLNAALIELAGIMARVAIFITITVMLPVNYAGSRWCLRPGP